MFKRYYDQNEKIDPITSFLFDYAYDEETSMIKRIRLNENASITIFILFVALCFIIFN